MRANRFEGGGRSTRPNPESLRAQRPLLACLSQTVLREVAVCDYRTFFNRKQAEQKLIKCAILGMGIYTYIEARHGFPAHS